MNPMQQLKRYEATSILLFINVFLYVCLVVSGGPTTANLIKFGGLFPPYVLLFHDYWRLISAAFLHASWLHLALNMMGLWVAGQIVESFFGRERTLLIYLLCSITSFAVSMQFGSLNRVAIGSSGAVFGFFAIIALLSRLAPYHSGLRAQSKSFALVIGLNLTLNMTMSSIDWLGHIGGLLGGVVAFYLLGYYKDQRQKQWVIFLLYCALLAFLLLNFN